MSRVLCLDEGYSVTAPEAPSFDASEFEDAYNQNAKLEEYDVLEASVTTCVAFLLPEYYVNFKYATDHHEDVLIYADESLEDGCLGEIQEGTQQLYCP